MTDIISSITFYPAIYKWSATIGTCNKDIYSRRFAPRVNVLSVRLSGEKEGSEVVAVVVDGWRALVSVYTVKHRSQTEG